jgi:ribulose-5-phosphate 4-epimerase/fuculose-1-phosphate aldolase
MAKDDIQELEEQCRMGALFLWQQLRDLYGHVSVRLPSGDGFMLKFVRAGAARAGQDPNEVQVYSYEGKKISGNLGNPAELPLYTEIFRRRPDVQSVVHAHPHVAVALSTTGKTIFATNHQTVTFGTGIPLFQGDMIDSVEIGSSLAEALGKGSAVLLKGHGVAVVGPSVPGAVSTCLYLEQAAYQQILASTVGTPEQLPAYLLEYHDRVGWSGGSSFLYEQLAWEAKMQRG